MKEQIEDLNSQGPASRTLADHSLELWFGDEASSRRHAKKRERILNLTPTEREKLLAQELVRPPLRVSALADGSPLEPFKQTRPQEGGHHLLAMGNGIGVVDIAGELTCENDPFNRFYGMVSYDEIVEAMLTAKDLGAKEVILNWASPGGTVMGCDDCAHFIAHFTDTVLPVYSFNGSRMTSAACWLGTSADEVWTARMAENGSVGVIAIHSELTQMMADHGVTIRVFRAGENKALGNPYEKLSDKAADVIQARVEESRLFFVEGLSRNIGKSTSHILDKIADGSVFTGEKAVQLGLANQVGTFAGLVGHILSRRNVDPQSGYGRIRGNTQRMAVVPMKITESSPAADAESAAETVAASASEPNQAMTDLRSATAGSGQEQLTLMVLDTRTDKADVFGEGPGLIRVSVVDDRPDEAKAAAPLVISPAIKLVSIPESEPVDSAAVASATAAPLQAQIEELTAQLAQASAVNTSLAGDVAKLSSQMAQTLPVLRTEINRMQVAMGGPALNLDALPVELLLVQYGALQPDFAKRFPGGAKTAAVEEGADEDALVEASAKVLDAALAKLCIID